MADITIAQLTQITPVDADILALWDASAAITGRATLAAVAPVINYLGLRQVSGSWTPQLQFGGANVGMAASTQAGRYVRTGSLVFYEGRVVLTAKGSSTGALTIANLPFAASAAYIMPASVFWGALATAMATVTGLPSGTAIALYGATAAATSLSALTDSAIAATSQMRFGGMYYTADDFPA